MQKVKLDSKKTATNILFTIFFVLWVFSIEKAVAQNSFGLVNSNMVNTGLNGSEVLGFVKKSYSGLKGSPQLLASQLTLSGDESKVAVAFASNSFGLLQRNVFQFQYIYDMPLSKEFKLGFMLGSGFADTRIRFDKAVWANNTSSTELIDFADNVWLVNAGLRVYSKNFLFGFLLNPAPLKQSWESLEVHMAGRFGSNLKFEPYITYKIHEAAFDFTDNAFLNKNSLQAGVMTYYEAFMIGAAFDYVKKASFAAGFQFQRMSCLYRYVHNLEHIQFSSHEISLRYDIAWKPMFKL